MLPTLPLNKINQYSPNYNASNNKDDRLSWNHNQRYISYPPSIFNSLDHIDGSPKWDQYQQGDRNYQQYYKSRPYNRNGSHNAIIPSHFASHPGTRIILPKSINTESEQHFLSDRDDRNLYGIEQKLHTYESDNYGRNSNAIRHSSMLPMINHRLSSKNYDEEYFSNDDKLLNLFEQQQVVLLNIASKIADQTNLKNHQTNMELDNRIRKLETETLLKDYERRVQDIIYERDEIHSHKKKREKKNDKTNDDLLELFVEGAFANKFMNKLGVNDEDLYNSQSKKHLKRNNKNFNDYNLYDHMDDGTNSRNATNGDGDSLSHENNINSSSEKLKNRIRNRANQQIPTIETDNGNIFMMNQNFSTPNNRISYPMDYQNMYGHNPYPYNNYNPNFGRIDPRIAAGRRRNLAVRGNFDLLAFQRNIDFEGERRKKEAEAKRIKEWEMKKAKLRKNLRVVLWTMAYPSLLYKVTLQKAKDQQQIILNEINSSIGMTILSMENLIINQVNGPLDDLYKETKHLCIVNGAEKAGKVYSDKELDDRTLLIQQHLSKIMNSMINIINKKNIQPQHLKFFCLIAQENGILPKSFMLEFEIKRLSFTYYAALKNVNATKTKMIIGMFIFFRIFIYKFLFKPWLIKSELKQSDPKFETVGSIVFHSLMYYYKTTLPIIPKNQDFLSYDMKVRPREPYQATEKIMSEDEILAARKNDKERKDEDSVLLGAFSYFDLKSYFVDRKKKADELKALIECWHTKIYEMLQAYYENEFLPTQNKKK